MVLLDEPRDDRHGLGVLALVVVGDELDLAALHASRGVAFIAGELDAVVGGDAEGGLGAGHGGIVADADRRLIGSGRTWRAPMRREAVQRMVATSVGPRPQKSLFMMAFRVCGKL